MQYMFLNVQELQKALQDRHLYKVAAATGLHVNTIRKIRDGVSVNPSYRVLEALTNYLRG